MVAMASLQKLGVAGSNPGRGFGVTKTEDGVPDQFPAGLRVLVVDDDTACLKILEQMLRKCDYNVSKGRRSLLCGPVFLLEALGCSSISHDPDKISVGGQKKSALFSWLPLPPPPLNIFGLWAYNAVWALAMAAKKVGTLNSGFQKLQTSNQSTDLRTLGISKTGPDLLKAISETKLQGLLPSKFLMLLGKGRGRLAFGHWHMES